MKPWKVHSEVKDHTLLLKFAGSLNEDVDLEKLKMEASQKIVIDLSEVDAINSCGSRGWIKWIKAVGTGTPVKFVNCSTVFLEYVNMIDGFIPKNGTIDSFSIPYFCESCGELTTKLFESDFVRKNLSAIPEKIKCSKCGKEAEADVIFPQFLKFLERA